MKVKIDKVEIYITDEDSGKRYKRFVELKDAETWGNFMTHVCWVAEQQKENPKWHLLNWTQIELTDETHPLFDSKLKSKTKKKLPKDFKN